MANVFKDGFESVINFVSSWANMFGVDWIDRIAGKKRGDWDEATLTKVISEIYKKIDQKDVSLINKLQQQLEGLIGVITSPTTKNIIKKWRQRIQERYNEAVKTQATHEFDKNSMQRLASDIGNLSPYEFTRKDKGEKLKEEFRQKVRDTVGNDVETQERVKKAEGWGKFKFNNKDDAQNNTKNSQNVTQVEERL